MASYTLLILSVPKIPENFQENYSPTLQLELLETSVERCKECA